MPELDIDQLLQQIPASGSFESAKLARQVLELVREQKRREAEERAQREKEESQEYAS